MAVRFDVLQFGDIFSIQVNGKETMGLTEEEIIFLHDKYRQAYKKPCMDDLMDKIEGLEGLLKLKDWEINELEEKYENLVSWALREKEINKELKQDNKELVTKFNFLKDALNDWKEMCKELKGENYDR